MRPHPEAEVQVDDARLEFGVQFADGDRATRLGDRSIRIGAKNRNVSPSAAIV
jgi:hypothetical protein